MTRSATERRSSVSVRHDVRHRRVLVGKPIGRISDVVNLLLGVCLRAARDMYRSGAFIEHRLNLIAYGEGPGNVREMPFRRSLGRSSNAANRGEKREDQRANENRRGNLQAPARARSGDSPVRLLLPVEWEFLRTL